MSVGAKRLLPRCGNAIFVGGCAYGMIILFKKGKNPDACPQRGKKHPVSTFCA